MKPLGFLGFSILTAIFVFMAGCSDTTPTVSILKSINSFEFVNRNIVTASLSSVPLQAKCSSFVSSVEVSFDAGVTWVSPSSHDPAAKSVCENGLFNMTLSSANAPLSTMTFSSGQTLAVKFRGLMRTGNWVYSDVSVKYVPSATISQEILAGSQTQAGAGMVLRGRVRAQSQQTAAGGGFVLRGRITQ